MAPQLLEFKPEKVAEAFAAFPPKLSALAEIFAAPEEVFEQQAAAAGVPVPPGPAKMTAQFMKSVESMAPALPSFTPLFRGGASGERTGEETYTSSMGSGSQKSEGGIDV